MKFNTTMKKILVVVMSLVLVITSITMGSVTSKAAEGNLAITGVTWSEAEGKVMFDVDFTSAYGDNAEDPYVYCIYLDEMNSEHAAINYEIGWNWKDNYQWPNENGGFHNDFKFDGVFTTAADYATNGKASTYLATGEHKVIVAAYTNWDDAKADTNPIATVEQALNVPEPTPIYVQGMKGAKFEGYVGTNWAYCAGKVTYDENGIIVANIENSGGGWNDAVWGIQAKIMGSTLPVGEETEYTATVLSTKDKIAYVKISSPKIDEANPEIEYVYEKIELKADIPYSCSFKFTPEREIVDIVWAFGSPEGEAAVTNVTVKISDNKIGKEEVVTTEVPTNQVPNETTTVKKIVPTTNVKAPKRAKINKVMPKKKSAKKVNLSLKRITGAKGYQVAIYKTLKAAKKNKKAVVRKIVKKVKVTVNSKKLRNKKVLFVKVRAFSLRGKTKIFGAWSKAKRVRIRK